MRAGLGLLPKRQQMTMLGSDLVTVVCGVQYLVSGLLMKGT